MTHYMVIEHFKAGAEAVYARFAERGRMAPEGLEYVSSWIDPERLLCYQVMRCADRGLLDEWMAHWSDIVNFEVREVISSQEARERFGG
jgi:hypothetical protein